MTDVVSARRKIQIEEVKYKAAISEATAQKMGGSVNWIIDNSTFDLGDSRVSYLSEATFQTRNGNNWVLERGQSIVGSDLHALAGMTALPDAVGNEAFIGQAGNDGDLGNYESSQNKAHTHTTTLSTVGTASTDDIGYLYRSGNDTGSRSESSSSNGGSVAKPNTIRKNIFTKINNEPT